MQRVFRGLAAIALACGALVPTTSAGAGGEPVDRAPRADAACRIRGPIDDFRQRVNVSPGHAQVWRQYQAFFLRQPDEGGLTYWFGVRARGATLSDIAYSFAESDEFRARYGRLGDEAFVDLVYRNVLCRTADASGRGYWVGQLRSGAVTRWDLVVNFAELREYLGRTRTCHSVHPVESAAAGCPAPQLRPLGQATIGTDGYQARDVTIARVGGGQGTLRGVDVDPALGLLRTGSERCGVASINANWLAAAGKDGPDPSVLGIGVVGGVHVRGSADRMDRGVLGLRFDRTPRSNSEHWPGDTGAEDRQRISSVLHHDGWVSIESWHSWAEGSPFLHQRIPEEVVGPDEWVWAVAGMVLILNGQSNPSNAADYADDPYTNQTLNHAVVLFDRETRRLFFGATSSLDVRDLVRWAEASGYEELLKFDGGASTEFNVGGRAVVAGTSRDIPVWFGIGC